MGELPAVLSKSMTLIRRPTTLRSQRNDNRSKAFTQKLWQSSGGLVVVECNVRILTMQEGNGRL